MRQSSVTPCNFHGTVQLPWPPSCCQMNQHPLWLHSGRAGGRRWLRARWCRRQRRGVGLMMMQAGLKHHEQPSINILSDRPSSSCAGASHAPFLAARRVFAFYTGRNAKSIMKDNLSTQSHFVGLLDFGRVHLLQELPHARLCSCLANTTCALRHFVCWGSVFDWALNCLYSLLMPSLVSLSLLW